MDEKPGSNASSCINISGEPDDERVEKMFEIQHQRHTYEPGKHLRCRALQQ